MRTRLNIKLILPIMIAIALIAYGLSVFYYGPERLAITGKKGVAVSRELGKGDELFEDNRIEEACLVYEAALDEDPKSYEAAWRLARAHSKLGMLRDSTEYLSMAVDYARMAIKLDKDSYEGHLYLVEALGLWLRFEGPADRVRHVREAKREIDIALKLEPDNYRSYLALGILNRKVTEASWIEKKLAGIFFGGLPPSSYIEAKAALQRSIELKPDFARSHYELALVELHFGEKERALELFKKSIACPITNKKEAELRDKAKLLYERIKAAPEKKEYNYKDYVK